MKTRSMTKKSKETKRKAEEEPSTEKSRATSKPRTSKMVKDASLPSTPAKSPENVRPKKKTKHIDQVSAAIRPRKREGTLYLRDLKIICVPSADQRPANVIECVNFHKEDIFGYGGENLNFGLPTNVCIYLVPLWTEQKELANITGFELDVSNVEDPYRQNLYFGFPGLFVYLKPTFDPSIQDRIIGLQLFRSRKYNPPQYGWAHTTGNINAGRGGDNLCLQWDLGNEQDVPGHKFRFRFWRR